MYLDRGLEDLVASHLTARPVVILEGARGVGKTRLASHLMDNGILAGEYFTFADESTFELANGSPKAFVEELPFGSVVDEAQLVPEIQLQLKRLVDADSRPGRVLLTGSVRISKDQLAGSAPLAGRSNTLRLQPFTRSERSGAPRSVIKNLLEGKPHDLDFVAETQADMLGSAIGGGFPLLKTGTDRQNFIEDALPESVIGRRTRTAVLEAGRQLAAKTSLPYVAGQLAKTLGIDHRTVGEYVDVWEDVMLVRRLINWRPSPGAAARAQQKLHVVDIGLATAWGHLDLDRHRGQLFETLVENELTAQLWGEPEARIYHYREKSIHEVDLVIENASSDLLIGVEVKSASEVRPQDFKQLRAFRERSRGRMKYGYVFYSGDKVLPAGDGLWAVPVPALWGPAPKAAASEPDLLVAISNMTAAVRASGNPSRLAARLPTVESHTESAVDEFAEHIEGAVAELGLESRMTVGSADALQPRPIHKFAASYVVEFRGTATSRQVAIRFDAAPIGADVVAHSVTLGQKPSKNQPWQVVVQVDGETSESEYDADVLIDMALTQMHALTRLLAQL